MKTTRLPAFLKKYFWDVDFNSLNFKESRPFILKRLLDRGDMKSLNWLKKHYQKEEIKEDIKELLLTTKDLSPKTANFWAIYLNISPQKVPCLQKPYSRIPFGLSS